MNKKHTHRAKPYRRKARSNQYGKQDMGQATRHNWVTCPACGKRSYPSRKHAQYVKNTKDLHAGDHLQVYPCRDGGEGWHIGHPNGKQYP